MHKFKARIFAFTTSNSTWKSSQCKRARNKINIDHKHLNQKLNFFLFMYNVVTAEVIVNYLCRKCKETYNTARTKQNKQKVDFAGLEVQD